MKVSEMVKNAFNDNQLITIALIVVTVITQSWIPAAMVGFFVVRGLAMKYFELTHPVKVDTNVDELQKELNDLKTTVGNLQMAVGFKKLR